MINININGIEYTTSQIDKWKKSRCPKVRHNLKLTALLPQNPISDLSQKS